MAQGDVGEIIPSVEVLRDEISKKLQNKSQFPLLSNLSEKHVDQLLNVLHNHSFDTSLDGLDKSMNELLDSFVNALFQIRSD